MIPELGTFCLGLALLIALIQATLPLVGVWRNDTAYMMTARSAAFAQWLFVVIAFGCLIYAFVNDVFSVKYVSQHSNSLLPSIYKVAATWGGHEGSILLWVVMLASWQLAVAIFSRSLPTAMVARVLAVMAWVAIGFLLFIIMTSNPFERVFPPPTDGQDLNPLLQDPGLIIHPPMLYMGYVGLSVAFAFAIAALLGGQLDAAWARWSRPWTTMAWVFLTAGITLGSWWAYYELGWGGWWFWDPVENASFMPWLVATALMHSLAATEKRSVFKSWTVLLAILGFSLSLLGTFLVRSGVLTSVHAFANDPERGLFILLFLGLVVGGSLLLYAFRAPAVRSVGQFDWFSREMLLLSNNVFLLVATATVLLGTLFPLIGDAVGQKISVGPPYFNLLFGLLMAPLLFLMAVGPWVRWKRHALSDLVKPLTVAGVASLIGGMIIPWLGYGKWVLPVALGVGLAMWIVLTTLHDVRQRADHSAGFWHGLTRMSRSYYGMVMGHLGMAMIAAGAVVALAHDVERDVAMKPGERVAIANYEFEFVGVKPVTGANFKAQRGHVKVYQEGQLLTELWPQKRTYLVQQMPMTESDIDPGLWRDLYVAMGEDLGGDAWSLRLQYKPLVRWIWGGGVMMLLGGLLAVSDRRYRMLREQRGAA